MFMKNKLLLLLLPNQPPKQKINPWKMFSNLIWTVKWLLISRQGHSISWKNVKVFFFFFFSTKIAQECIKAKSAGPVPIAGMKGQVPPCKNAPTCMHSAVNSWTGAQNLKPFMSFAHNVSSSVKPLLKCVSKLTVARFWKSIQGGKQTKNLWSQSVFLSFSLALSLNLFLQCTKADKIIFSDNNLLVFIFPKSNKC